jgi:ATP-dependent Clp protease ATP-binding subunit ClpC
VIVDPPSIDETVEILKGLRKKYEDHHKVTIPDSTLVCASKLSERYITDRFLPDKAIDVIDEAARGLVSRRRLRRRKSRRSRVTSRR